MSWGCGHYIPATERIAFTIAAMNAWIGWTLAAVLLLVGWLQYGWPGLAFAATAVVFWLLLQFNKAVRVMRQAGSAPVGYVDSAVMLNARLKAGMNMMQVVIMTRSLGQKLGDEPEQYRWTDAGGSHVTLELRRGKLSSWTLWRPQAEGEGGGEDPGAAPADRPANS